MGRFVSRPSPSTPLRPPCDWDRAGKQREAPNRGRAGRTRQQQPRGEGSRRAPPEPVQEAHADAGWLGPAGDVGAAGAGLALSRGLDCGRPDRLSPSSLHHHDSPNTARPFSLLSRPANALSSFFVGRNASVQLNRTVIWNGFPCQLRRPSCHQWMQLRPRMLAALHCRTDIQFIKMVIPLITSK